MFKRWRSKRSQQENPRSQSTSGASVADISRQRQPSTSGSFFSSRSVLPEPSGLGLHVVHQPELVSLDIIFVHGLGGHSQWTWAKNHDSAFFWPKVWLPFEPEVETARIMTFGYNAKWRGASKCLSSITDFAKELLFEMRFAKDASGTDLGIGENPIIFVVHSMGGLVVKKAYLLGFHDDNFKQLIPSISAFIFLSTPHRGTNLAKTLNRVLSVSFQSTKAFISDLDKSSPVIEELNEQFRHIAPRLSIWSFYETLSTSIGPRKIMVLEKESSVLGYPTEISRPLHANHQDVCKYSSPIDANYISVSNAIKSLMASYRAKEAEQSGIGVSKTTTNIQELFRNCQTSDEDYNTLLRCRITKTCEWFLRETEVSSWCNPSPESRILWYTAPPASGKSVLSAFTIKNLRDLGLSCQFFFFKSSDQSKRSVASCLTALVFQLVKDLPEFKTLLGGASPDGLGLRSHDSALIWRNTFENNLFQIAHSSPMFWVIDGLDECESPKTFLQCLASLSRAQTPVKVLLLSRNTKEISISLDRLSHSIPFAHVEKTGHLHNQQDIVLLVEQELRHMRGTLEFKERLMESVINRSEGNFLWTKLVLDEIMECHTEESIQEVLKEIPDDMTQLYQKMEQSLIDSDSSKRSNKRITRAFLEWSICAQRPLTLDELSDAIEPNVSGFIDLKRTVKETCGQFLQVDDKGKVGVLHHTAREYLTRHQESHLYVDTRLSHGKCFLRTLEVLEDEKLRWRLMENQHSLQASEPFRFYAALNWPYHFSHSHSDAPEYLEALARFLQSPAILVWIQMLALLRRLEVLIRASKALSIFVQETKKRNASSSQMLHRLSDLELLDDWSVDLAKIVGKFGRNLATEPALIYDIVPALCPASSIMKRQFYRPDEADLKILGDGEGGWSDNLSRLAVPFNAQAWKICCAGRHIAVLVSTGAVHFWDSSNFARTLVVSHGEPVTGMVLNDKGTQLATYGLKTTKVWGVPTGKLLLTAPNPTNVKAMTVVFAEQDSKLLLGGDDNTVRYLQLQVNDPDSKASWKVLNPSLLKDGARIDGAVVNSPMCLAFSADKSHVGVSYRGAPLSIWRLRDGRCINRCKRAKEFRNDQRRPSSTWFAVDRFTWNPATGHVLGIYKDGCVFKWHPLTDENVEARKPADEIAASPNGKLFATSSSDGSVRVWNFAYFTVIYQLSSEDLVTELAFSPDNQRFYDLRGDSVNAWESNSLVRFIEAEEYISDSNSGDQSSAALSKFSEEVAERFEAVTAFGPSPDGSSYCVGYEDGAVYWFRKGDAVGIEFTRFYNFLPVTHIAWSRDGHMVAVADLAGEIQVKSVPRDGPAKLNKPSLPAPQIPLDGPNIEALLFDIGGDRLLIATEDAAFVCSVESGDLRARTDQSCVRHRKWLPHPKQAEYILAISTKNVLAFAWDTLDLACSATYHSLSGQKPCPQDQDPPVNLSQLSLDERDLTTLAITKAVSTHNLKDILIHLRSQDNNNPKVKEKVMIITNICLGVTGSQCLPPVLDFLELPHQISSQVKLPLGILPGPKFAFLDHDLWFCTYSLEDDFRGDTGDSCHRFYFIPRDWMGRTSLENCTLTESGTLFWPKDDRVVVIECTFDEMRPSSVF